MQHRCLYGGVLTKSCEVSSDVLGNLLLTSRLDLCSTLRCDIGQDVHGNCH